MANNSVYNVAFQHNPYALTLSDALGEKKNSKPDRKSKNVNGINLLFPDTPVDHAGGRGINPFGPGNVCRSCLWHGRHTFPGRNGSTVSINCESSLSDSVKNYDFRNARTSRLKHAEYSCREKLYNDHRKVMVF